MFQNRIELFWNNSPISIEQAFAIHLQKDTLLEYRAYKKLVQQGIRVIRTNKKVTGPPPRKRVKIDKSAIISKEKKNKFHDLFVNLQKNGPQLDDRTLDVNYDFKISLPSSGGCFNYTFTYVIIIICIHFLKIELSKISYRFLGEVIYLAQNYRLLKEVCQR